MIADVMRQYADVLEGGVYSIVALVDFACETARILVAAVSRCRCTTSVVATVSKLEV